MIRGYPEIYLFFKMARTRIKKSRTLGFKSASKSASKVINRPKKLRIWEDDAMKRAIDAIKSGRMGTNRAALEYAVPRTTLKDRLTGRVIHGVKMGAKPYLSNQEEQELVEFLLNCAKMGYGKTRRDILNIVHATLLKKTDETGEEFLKDKVSQGWWMKFCSRWPQIRLRKGDSFPVARDQMTNYSVFKDYFDLLDDTLTKFGLKDKPAQIINCDESGMPLEFKLPKIIAGKGTKKVRHSLDQATDSLGSPSDGTLVGSVSIEHVPLNDASVPIDDPAAHNDNTAEPNDSTTGPIDDTTEPNDDTTEPNDHTAESNDVTCELDTSECNSNTSPITKVPNTSDHLSGTQTGENLVHKHMRASVMSPTVTMSTQKIKRSPLADLLVYPTPTQQKAKPKSSARVLTSAESIALLEEKVRKKQEEKEETERKKKERNEKKSLRGRKETQSTGTRSQKG